MTFLHANSWDAKAELLWGKILSELEERSQRAQNGEAIA
jgi:hypothetical protein